MISIEECKKILLDNGEFFSDEEIKLIREHLYKASKIALETNTISKKKSDGKNKKI